MRPEYSTPTFSEIIRSYPFRIGIYAVATLLVFEGVYAGIRVYGAGVMGAENGPIEVAQVVLAIIGSIGLFYAARRSPLGRSGLVFCGAAVGYAAARESDMLFEAAFFDDAYKYLVGLPLGILCIAILIADRRRLVADAMWLMRHPAATLFTVAGVFLCFVCQILDRPEMWIGLGTVNGVDTTKALIEEYAELFAYVLLAFSGIEAAILARQVSAVAEENADQSSLPEEIRIAA